MADLASDHDLAIELVRIYYLKLAEVVQNHPLLKLVNKNRHPNLEALSQRYKSEKERKSERIEVARVLAAYAAELKKAYEQKTNIKEEPKGSAEFDISSLENELGDKPLPF